MVRGVYVDVYVHVHLCTHLYVSMRVRVYLEERYRGTLSVPHRSGVPTVGLWVSLTGVRVDSWRVNTGQETELVLFCSTDGIQDLVSDRVGGVVPDPGSPGFLDWSSAG